MKVNASFRGPAEHARNVRTTQRTAQNKDRGDSRVKNTKPVSSDEFSQKGVIRHLHEGHYKGVADVRLRLNFQAELQNIQRNDGSALVRQTAAELTATVSSELDALISSVQLGDQQISAVNNALVQFETDVASVVSDFSDPQVASTDLRSTVDAFLSTLKQLLTTEPGTSPIEATTPIVDATTIAKAIPIDPDAEITPGTALETELSNVADTTDEPTDGVDQFPLPFDNFFRVINQFFDNLQSSLLESGLPEPTAPNGNGVAYEKFLAIYRQNQV